MIQELGERVERLKVYMIGKFLRLNPYKYLKVLIKDNWVSKLIFMIIKYLICMEKVKLDKKKYKDHLFILLF